MWLGFFSPFRHIIRSKHIINDVQGKALRQTFWQKLKATYEVFAGRTARFWGDPEAHAGFLEYLTLLIAIAINHLIVGLISLVKDKHKAFWFPVVLFILIVIIPCFVLYIAAISLLAIAVTILVSPLVGIVHLFTKTKGEKLRKDALLTKSTSLEENAEENIEEHAVKEKSTIEITMQKTLYKFVEKDTKPDKNASETTAVLAALGDENSKKTVNTQRTQNKYKCTISWRYLDVSLEDLCSVTIDHHVESAHKVHMTYQFSIFNSFNRNERKIGRRELKAGSDLKTTKAIDINLDLTQKDDRLIFKSLVGLNAGGLKNAYQDDGIDPAQLISNAKTAAPA